MRALALAALLAAPLAAAAAPVPALTGPVVDEAGLLRPGEVRALEALARAARATGGGAGPQLQYLIVPSLDGEPIEDFSIRAAERWKIGTRGRDDGILVTVAVADRKVRIEVGGGLEGALTDAQSARIVREVIAPAFRAGRYFDGLRDAGVQILSALGALPAGELQRQAARPSSRQRLGGLGTVALVVLFLVLRTVFFGFVPSRRRSFWWGGPFGGGMGGFGGGLSGGGGGGWSGGGGGFSGGGASGGW